jgi:MFS family permease
MLYPTLVALVVDRTPAVERGRAIGTLSGAWDVGVAVGAPTIALLVQSHGYGAGFLASAVTMALGLATFLATEHYWRFERRHGSAGARERGGGHVGPSPVDYRRGDSRLPGALRAFAHRDFRLFSRGSSSR